MKKSIIFICFFLMLPALRAYGGPLPKAAPVNPDFLDYLEEKESGTLVTVTEDGHGLGEIPPPVMPNFDAFLSTPHVQAALTDRVYDLRTLGLITSVKNQGSCGSCWAFATMGSVESRWKVLSLGNFNLSENNLKNCSGFVYAPCYGGNILMSAAYFSRKSGPPSEAADPYVPDNGTCTTGLAEQAYIPDLRLLPNDRNTIKQAIIDYGIIYTNFYWDPSYYTTMNYTYFCPGSIAPNHAVGLAGWADNITTAGGMGAWIVKNSWDTTWGDAGYFYISYNDASVNQLVGYFPERLDYDATSNVYYYDKLGWLRNWGYGTGVAYGLIKFTSTQTSEYLYKVGTYVVADNATIDIEVYDSFDNTTTTLSGLRGSLTGQSCRWPGYYTFTLSTPISLTNGDDFYIKVKYSTPSEGYPLPAEEVWDWTYANPAIETGKCWMSYYGTSSTWTSVGADTSYKIDICIKGYASTVAPPTTTTTEPTTTTTEPTTTTTEPTTTTTELTTTTTELTTTTSAGPVTTTTVEPTTTTTSVGPVTTTTVEPTTTTTSVGPVTTTTVEPTTTTTSVGPVTTTTVEPITTTTSVATTTTTVPATSTTTTTALGRPCPARNTLGEGNPNLENLRAFRDSKLGQSALGRKVIQIYYNNADSIDAALSRSPALRAAARRVLEAIAPMVGK